MQTIPFHRPYVHGTEMDYVRQAVESGQLSGDGPFARRCSDLLERRFGMTRVLLTPSCTAALELAALLCRLEPGDEVIMPSYTFVSTAIAVLRAGAEPVFVDARPDTLNMDESLIADAISPRTRAIIPVHYAGVGCEMDPILQIARDHRLIVVEDAAQALDAWQGDRGMGSLGPLAALSFHATKNIHCGEGGALCVNDPSLIERAEVLRDKGTNRRQFFRGQVDKYTWVDTGSSYLASELCAAFLYGQLEALDTIGQLRSRLYHGYLQRLQPLEMRGRLRLMIVPPHCRNNHHMFYILLNSEAQRDGLLDFLKQQGIESAFHFVPLHSSSMGRRFRTHPGRLSVTEDMAGRLLRLPFYVGLEEQQLDRVAAAIDQYLAAS